MKVSKFAFNLFDTVMCDEKHLLILLFAKPLISQIVQKNIGNPRLGFQRQTEQTTLN